MGHFVAAMQLSVRRLYRAISRFPLTVVSLLGASVLICYMISLHEQPGPGVVKLAYTFLFGSFLGILAQFACERFDKLNTKRVAVYFISALLTIGYYLILVPLQSIGHEVSIRTFVAVTAMFCAFVWVPSCQSRADFNDVALVHFKSALIAILYAAVLSFGCASIIAAVDILLFNVNNDLYAYTMTIIWVLFATLYYLSLLPLFNAEEAGAREFAQESASYPRFLEILVSYISIPLVGAFTLVLAAYFIKILFTMKWPSGQLGGMILAYSSAGLIIYILASPLKNRFASLYRLIFPKVLIPVIIMQLISVGIRLDAYGVTESRYYIALFGIFAILSGTLLSFRPVSHNGLIALLAAGFAIVSVIPPIDAFTVSRSSQITRLESMLQIEGILSEGQITPKAEASLNLRLEVTSILSYLQSRDYMEYLTWLPADFNTYRDMNTVLGFEPAYSRGDAEEKRYFANLDSSQPIDISGYEIMVNTDSPRGMMTKNGETAPDLEISGQNYKVILERLSAQEVRVAVQDSTGTELVGTGLYDFAISIATGSLESRELRTPAQMTLDVENNGYKLRVVFRNIYITIGDDPDAGADYELTVMFNTP